MPLNYRTPDAPLTTNTIALEAESINRRLLSTSINGTKRIVDSSATAFTLRSQKLPDVGSVLQLVSSSASDTMDVVVTGLDDNLDRISETVTMTGTTPVSTTLAFKRWYQVVCLVNSNVGTITLSQGGNTVGIMAIDDSNLENGIVTVPNGFIGYISRIDAETSRNEELVVEYRFGDAGAVGDLSIAGAKYIVTQGQGALDIILPPLRVGSGTDIYITAQSNTGNADVSIAIDLTLIPED